jgi:hypothetical protein
MKCPTESVVVTTVVAVDASTTVALFMEELNLRWKQSPRFGGALGTLRSESDGWGDGALLLRLWIEK